MLTRRYSAVEVDARDLTGCRLLAAFHRERGGDLPVALLAFSDAVELVHTSPEHRRRGIAAALLDLARSELPDLGYSADHTAVGAAWGRAQGLVVPDVEEHVDDTQVAWAASSVYLYLTHVTAEEVVWRRPLRLRRRSARPRPARR